MSIESAVEDIRTAVGEIQAATRRLVAGEPGSMRAGHDALDRIDGLISQLHTLRVQVTTKLRADSAQRADLVDALLVELGARDRLDVQIAEIDRQYKMRS